MLFWLLFTIKTIFFYEIGQNIINSGYFTSDNEPGGIENATHSTSGGKAGYLSPRCPGLRSNVLWVAISVLPGSYHS
jgi:hypothetical protein